jgi:hypothetical protein
MKFNICPTLAVFLLMTASVNAAGDDKTQDQPGGLFTGTPEEQTACAPDATRFCSDAIPDTFRVLACLQEHRKRLKKACAHVLEAHGQ